MVNSPDGKPYVTLRLSKGILFLFFTIIYIIGKVIIIYMYYIYRVLQVYLTNDGGMLHVVMLNKDKLQVFVIGLPTYLFMITKQ